MEKSEKMGRNPVTNHGDEFIATVCKEYVSENMNMKKSIEKSPGNWQMIKADGDYP